MKAVADTVEAATITEAMGGMCHRSYFFALRDGEALTQVDIDAAAHAFITLTERLLPAPLVARFITHACARGTMPQIDQAELVPGFTHDESLAGAEPSRRLAQPRKKFARSEVLACLAENRARPALPVAIAHFVSLLYAFTQGLEALVGRRSPEAAAALSPFLDQWAPKNVLKFFNVAIFVSARAHERQRAQRARGKKGSRQRRQARGPLLVDRPVLEEAMNLLNRSGAFTWSADDDAATLGRPLRIHCPAQSFLHKLVVHEGALGHVIDFVATEARRTPLHPDLAASFAFVRAAAAREAERITEDPGAPPLPAV